MNFDDLVWQLGETKRPPTDRHTAPAGELPELSARLDKLTLINMAMWSLLRDKTGVTEADLLARMEQIDLLDGVKDGKVSKQPIACGGCGRQQHPRHARCVYCGESMEAGPPKGFKAFDGAV